MDEKEAEARPVMGTILLVSQAMLVTPHTEHGRGKEISVGVLIYVYIMFVDQKN